uniref:Snf2 family helicase n=1 Tax=Moniliophthora roreri TaxID=221103 RepID=A0A0W0FFE1_MONRR
MAERFLSATFQLRTTGKFVLRVYLIPYDLPGQKGSLSRKQRSKEKLGRARMYMSNILPRIVQDVCKWAIDGTEVETSRRYLLDSTPDTRTLSEIYEDLPSPQPQRHDIRNPFTTRLLDFDDHLGGLGLSSTLHHYQRRSVAAMIQMEHEERIVSDPLYISLTDMNGKKFYYQPGTTEVLSSVSNIASRGGVLCEELGTGKTVMVLALVLSNLHSLSSPESPAGEKPTILTPLSLRFQPGHDYPDIGRTRPGTNKQSTLCSFPSLRELLVDRLSRRPNDTIPDITTPKGQRIDEKRQHHQDMVEQLPTKYFDWVSANTPFYIRDRADLTDARITDRASSLAAKCGSRAMYLTSATLIVVPANLLTQWDREIQKHCEEPPRVLIVRNKQKLPSARELATVYDIILMTYPRFADEEQHSNLKACKYKPCKCPEFPGSRVPNCKCASPKISPLLQIHWKRLVIDEGHVSASLTTRLTPFAKLLSVECRWIVTGTPTTNLLGLSFGNRSSEDGLLDIDMTEASQNTADLGTADVATETSLDTWDHAPARVWTEADGNDIQKLLNMLIHFVGLKYLADVPMVKATIKDALLDHAGPRPGAIEMFTQLMSMTMVRHRIEDVEREAVLPKLDHQPVLLDLDPYAAKSYNALQAAIAINAIDSERTDEDYMFHPKNNEFLQLTVKNMSQLLFWSVDQELYNIDELHKNSHKTIERLKNRPNLQESDLKLAEEAYFHVQAAHEDALWKRMQTIEDVPYRVQGVNAPVFESWSRLSGFDRNRPTFMHPDSLVSLRNIAFKHPFKPQVLLVELGQTYAKIDAQRRREYEAYMAKKEGSKGTRLKQTQAVHLAKNNNDRKIVDTTKTEEATAIIKEMKAELSASLNRLELDDTEMNDTSHSLASRNAEVNATRESRLANPSLFPIRISSSASSKLNYIIDDVLRHSADEKYLIFSESELTLAHVAEGLQLAGVKFLRFTTQVPQQVREQCVLTFETSDLYRVFLMELKHGARGLNLITASRVIFCEPVWQADVESQAIKRAHRIGQTRPVHVKTLAIRGTAEDKMLEWKRTHKQSRGSKVPKLPLEQVEIRHFIANPRFLPTNTSETTPLDIPLLTHARPADQIPGVKKPVIHFAPPTTDSVPGSGKKRLHFEDPPESGTPKKKRIMFAV